MRTTVITDTQGAPRQSGGGNGAVARASGGIIPGPPSTADTVPAMLSTGEYVVNAAQTARHLPVIEAINAGTYQAFAGGGQVGTTYTSAAAISPRVTTTAPTSGGDTNVLNLDNAAAMSYARGVALEVQTVRGRRDRFTSRRI